VFRLGRFCRIETCLLIVQRRAKNGNDEVSEMRSSFIQLQPTHHAVVGEIFGYAAFGDAEIFGQPRFYRIDAAAARATAKQVANGDAERRARFDVVVACKIGIGEHQYAGTRRSVIGLTQLRRRTAQQSPKLHFENRQTGGEPRIAGAPADAYTGRLSGGFGRRRRAKAARCFFWRPGLDCLYWSALRFHLEGR
jgi:hypothetical protein